ncbi:hypothetical protein FOZ60_016919 [Perkinsus olseni]|uniref:Uncharacterized protein n=1 Tax=Perkinsus olseni TaxID=32597 RepID=A0A7J6P4M3_PEROL|nr:hypothetical protein FOZ60_016919 [Perkinsus olseni]
MEMADLRSPEPNDSMPGEPSRQSKSSLNPASTRPNSVHAWSQPCGGIEKDDGLSNREPIIGQVSEAMRG